MSYNDNFGCLVVIAVVMGIMILGWSVNFLYANNNGVPECKWARDVYSCVQTIKAVKKRGE